MNQTTFAIHAECPRCAGFARAFANFPGRVCFRCNGSLRAAIIRPMWRLTDHRLTRAEAVEIIAHALTVIGAPHTRDSRGRTESPYGFVQHAAGDTWNVLAACFSRCDATVRARGYRAAVAKILAHEWSKGTAESRVDALNRATAAATGIPADRVAEWATGETAAIAA